MKINEFLEKFLPNYYSRDDVARYLDLDMYLSMKMDEKKVYEFQQRFPTIPTIKNIFEEFIALEDKLYSEALQNFADNICEEQSRNCADYYQESIGYTQPDNYIYNGILEAQHPNIEEL